MPSKPKRWLLGDEDEKCKLYHYEAPDGSGSGLWIDLRYVKATQVFNGIRSNAFENEKWMLLRPPQTNYAVAKRRAFEMFAQACVGLVT
jgi:hypothetical protein